MFGTNHGIPSTVMMHMSKLEGGVINTDTCNAAQLTCGLLIEAVEHSINEKFVNGGGDVELKPVIDLKKDCHTITCVMYDEFSRLQSTYH